MIVLNSGRILFIAQPSKCVTYSTHPVDDYAKGGGGELFAGMYCALIKIDSDSME